MSKPRKPLRRRQRRYVPAFSPVPLRGRSDGWTPIKQGVFLGILAETRCVRTAAQRVGMSRESAYRLRRRPAAGSFAAAWDIAAGRVAGAKPKVTHEELRQRALCGLLKPLLYRGRYVSIVRKADDTALLRWVAQIQRGCGRALDGEAEHAGFAPQSGSTYAGISARMA